LRGGRSKPRAHANSRTSSSCDAMAFALLVMIHAGRTIAMSSGGPSALLHRRILSAVCSIAWFGAKP
jgi:hypothetical protein